MDALLLTAIIFDESVDTDPGIPDSMNKDIIDSPLSHLPGDDWEPHYPQLEPFPVAIGPEDAMVDPFPYRKESSLN